MQFDAASYSASAGSFVTITVEARDQFENVDTAFNGKGVTINVPIGVLSTTGSGSHRIDFVNGVAITQMRAFVTSTGIPISFSDIDTGLTIPTIPRNGAAATLIIVAGE